MEFTLEIATGNYTATAAAVAGGADRIELCSALSEGGLTPSQGYLLQCRADFALPIFPIIRPRGGDFLYSAAEFKVMKHDIEFCKAAGFEGIVTGFLLQDGSIDAERTREAVQLAAPMQVTFHRAFDRCVDPFVALETIIEAGCKRILTSGQQLKAMDGAALIGRLITAASNRIVIMPGSGVRKENIAQLAQLTGAIEMHSSAKTIAYSNMGYVNTAFKSEEGEYTKETVSPQDVSEMKNALANCTL